MSEHLGFEFKFVFVGHSIAFKVMSLHGMPRRLVTQPRIEEGMRLHTGATLANLDNHWTLISKHVSYADILHLVLFTREELV